MSATVPDRAVVRKWVATQLSSAVTSAQAVYNHAAGDFGGQTPVLRVVSGGSARVTSRLRQATFSIMIEAWVLYTSPDDDAYTEANSEDLIDAIDKEIATWLETASTSSRDVRLAGPSETMRVQSQSGVAYTVELFPLEITEL